MAELHLSRGDLLAATDACSQARALAQQRNDVLREAEALKVRGVIRREQCDYDEAARDLAESAALAWAADDRFLMAEVARETGELCRLQGRIEEARAAFGRALDFYRTLGARHAQEEMVRRLAQIAA
jgi:tetratricopeptide (TPR) repeat protein